MIKKMFLCFLCLSLFLSIPCCKKKLPTSPDIPGANLPTIKYFTASPAEIDSGGVSVLAWFVENANDVVIDPDIGVVGHCDSKGVWPTATTVYTLTATNNDGQKTSSVTVTVNIPRANVKLTEGQLYFSIDHVAGKAYVQVRARLTNSGDAVALNVRLYVHLFDANGDRVGWACTLDVFERLEIGASETFNKGKGSSSLLDYVTFADAEETLKHIEVKFESE